MTDFAGFQHGNVVFPLPLAAVDGMSLLRAADPALFYALEFYASVIETHIGDRLLEEAAACGATHITSAVAETLPLNPEPFLTESHLRFPLLSMYRKSTAWRFVGQRRISQHEYELAYVLPPMRAAEADSLLPILHAVEVLIDNRTSQGFDPAYTPSTPTGTAGEPVWSASRAGLVRVDITGGQTGAYVPTPDLYFPAVIISMTMEERSDALLTELEDFAGADVDIDVSADSATVDDVTQFSSFSAPVITSLDVDTGTKDGGTAVVITGTGFIVGRSYRAVFGDSDASSVIAESATTLSCLTPQYAAYPTVDVDVYVIDQDDQISNVMPAAFTFTST